MADPQHVAVLDGFDRLTVRLYRLGLVAAAGGVLALGVVELLGVFGVRGSVGGIRALVVGGVLLAVLDMHLYDKRIRWAIALLGLLGAFLWGLGGWLVDTAGLGFAFAALSGFALKERFCFRIPGLGLVPVLLAGSLPASLFGLGFVSGPLLVLAGLLLSVLAGTKLAMPLHYDVGDKSAYQV